MNQVSPRQWTKHLFPFVPDLQTYTKKRFKADLIAAATVAPIALPQAMAYAVIAGVHPKYGLYASLIPVILAALWGSSRYLVAGPTNAISMILFSTLAQVSVGGVIISSLPPDERMPYVFGLALLAGLIQVAMGAARLGELANFISHSVMVGFTSGAALLIVTGQIKTMLGLQFASASGFVPSLFGVFEHIHQINWWSLSLTCCTIVTILACRRFSRHIPATLCGLLVTSIIAWIFNAGEHGVRLVGSIPQEMPPISYPPRLDLGIIRDMFLPALAIALLGAVESLAIGKKLAAANKEDFDGSQELIGQGIGNIAAGLTSGIPGCASLTRSVLNITSGARTRFAAVFAGLLSIPILLVLAPLAGYIPMPTLGGILLLIAWGMIDKDAIRLCLVATRIDRAVLLVTFCSALLLDLEQAVFIGVLLSLTLFLYKEAHPRVARLSPASERLAPFPWVKGCPHLSIFTIEGTLFFGAIHELERQLMEQEEQPTQCIILQLTGVFWLDASGAHALEQFAERCHARSIPLILVVNDTVHTILDRTGVLEPLGEGFVTPTLIQALETARGLLRASPCRHCPSQQTCHQQQTVYWPGNPLPPGEGYGTRQPSTDK